MSILSVGMAFCDIPLRPCPANIMELDNFQIDNVEYHTGGDALTVAVVLAKMGEDVTLIARIGEDVNGIFVKNELEANNVKTDRLILQPGYPTATSYQLIEMNGQRHFIASGRINTLMTNVDVTDEDIEKCDIIFFGSSLAMSAMNDDELSTLFRRAHAAGKITAMDASVSVPDQEEVKMNLLRKTLQETDIFIPSYEEASYLAQKTDVMEIMEAFKDFPLKVFGIKLGEKGCILTEDFKNYITVAPYGDKPVIDTTGAGDCFMGGFLCAYTKGWPLKKCAQFASAVSAHGISALGPSAAVPDYDTVKQFMDQYCSE